MNNQEIMAAVRRSEQARCEQIGRWESLDIGVAHFLVEWPTMAEGNQLRQVWLADEDPERAFQQAESFYQDHGIMCHSWTLAADQAIHPIETLLLGKGWQRHDLIGMGLTNQSAIKPPQSSSIRVLPARAMPRAYRRTFAESHPGEEAIVHAAFQRLDDSNLDVFVAMVDDQPAARVGYLEVGDIARLSDFWVAPRFFDQRVGDAMMIHFFQIVRRLSPRAVVACVQPDQEQVISLLMDCGFSQAGSIAQFHRPA